jgi:acetyltransferase-like isoleucine patch superfamily enzyme
MDVYRKLIYPLLSVASQLLAAALLGLALVPPFLLVRAVFEALQPLANLLKVLAFCISVGFGFIVFGIALLSLIVLAKWSLGIKSVERRDSIYSAAAAKVALLNFLLNLATFAFLPLLHSNYFLVWFYRGMGAKIGIGTVLSTHRLWDCDLIEIGEDCLIGSNSSIAAHTIVGNSGRLRKVRIGSRVTIGANSSVMPGVVIEDDVIVGSNSLVPQGAHLESGGVYMGVPAQRIN